MNTAVVQHFYIRGMHCDGCQRKLQRSIMGMGGISSVRIDIESGKAIMQSAEPISREQLAGAIKSAGEKYSLAETPLPSSIVFAKKMKKFAPLIIAFSSVCLITAIPQLIYGFNLHDAMHIFMGAFFLIFGGLKVFNWASFAESYRMYDPLAKRSAFYAHIYPAIEIYLGVSYASRFLEVPFKAILFPEVVANIVTIVILGIATSGILQKLSKREEVRCACVGGFNIPITWFTVFENILMIAMAIAMQLLYGRV